MVDKRPVPKQECSLDFLDLIPGQAYSLTVQSVSGTLTNGVSGAARTGRCLRRGAGRSRVSWVTVPLLQLQPG